jgi:hypothetical protein
MKDSLKALQENLAMASAEKKKEKKHPLQSQEAMQNIPIQKYVTPTEHTYSAKHK